MLPLINPRAADLGGLADTTAPDSSLSKGSDSNFAGILNGPVSAEAHTATAKEDGQALPQGGKVLPTKLSDGESPAVAVEQALPEIPISGLELLDGSEMPSGLNPFGQDVVPITPVVEPEWLIGQPGEAGLAADELAESGAVRLGELAAELNPELVNQSGQVSGVSLALLSQQQLSGRGISGFDTGQSGNAINASARQSMLISEAVLTAPGQQQTLKAAASAVEQTLSTSLTLAGNSALSGEAGKITGELLEGATRRLNGSNAPASASLLHTSLAGSVSLGSPASSTAPQPASVTPPAMQIGVPVQDPAWSNMLGQRVVMMTGQQLQTAEIRLSPAELGPITVNLVVEDGAAELTFLAQHSLTREAIEQALPKLREMLDENGLSLGNATVSDQDLQKHGFGDKNPEGKPANGAAEEGAGAEGSEGLAPARISQGLIDTFV